MEQLKNSNKSLVDLLKKGDMAAFDAIYERYAKRLYGFVLRYIKQEEDAKEIVQEVFITIWETREKIETYYSFESFIFTIAYNSTISLLRKKISESKYIDHLKSLQYLESDDNVTNEIHFQEINEQVQKLINQLTPRQREVFKLSREEGLTHKEIAEKLNISTNTVKNHLVSTISFLKSNIDNSLIVNLLFVSLFL